MNGSTGELGFEGDHRGNNQADFKPLKIVLVVFMYKALYIFEGILLIFHNPARGAMLPSVMSNSK